MMSIVSDIQPVPSPCTIRLMTDSPITLQMTRTLEVGHPQNEGHHLSRNDDEAVNERLVKRLTEEASHTHLRAHLVCAND